MSQDTYTEAFVVMVDREPHAVTVCYDTSNGRIINVDSQEV